MAALLAKVSAPEFATAEAVLVELNDPPAVVQSGLVVGLGVGLVIVRAAADSALRNTAASGKGEACDRKSKGKGIAMYMPLLRRWCFGSEANSYQ